MTKTIVVSILILNLFNSKAQKIEVSSGLNRNTFFDYSKSSPHTSSQYTSGNGFSFSISISDFKIDSLPLKVSLSFDNYQGNFSVTDGGIGSSSTTKAYVKKNTFGLGLYPLNFKLYKKIEFNFGGEFGFLISDITTGETSSLISGYSSVSDISTKTSLDNHAIRINNNNYFGLSGIISYNINVGEKWFISPQYKCYFGLKNEFKNTEASAKSLRNNFSIGISRIF